MVHPQVADRGTIFIVVGSCEYIGISNHRQPTRCCPPVWGSGELLTTLYFENWSCYETDTFAFSLEC